MCIELRTIDADELGLAAHGHTAGAAHTRSIHHDGVKAGFGGDVILGGRQRHKLHHNRRTNGDTLIHFLAVDDLLHADRHHSFLSDRTIVCHEDNLVGPLCQFILQDDEVFVTCCEHGDDAVAGFLERFGNRQHRGCAYATAGTYDRTVFLNARSATQRTDDVMQTLTRFHVQQLMRGCTDALYY